MNTKIVFLICSLSVYSLTHFEEKSARVVHYHFNLVDSFDKIHKK